MLATVVSYWLTDRVRMVRKKKSQTQRKLTGPDRRTTVNRKLRNDVGDIDSGLRVIVHIQEKLLTRVHRRIGHSLAFAQHLHR